MSGKDNCFRNLNNEILKTGGQLTGEMVCNDNEIDVFTDHEDKPQGIAVHPAEKKNYSDAKEKLIQITLTSDDTGT